MYHNSVVSQRVDDTRLLTVMSTDSSVDLQHRILMLNICYVVLCPSRKPAYSSAMMFSASEAKSDYLGQLIVSPEMVA